MDTLLRAARPIGAAIRADATESSRNQQESAADIQENSMTLVNILPAADLAVITGYKSPSGQKRWLGLHRWRFVENAAGHPIVATAYALQKLGVAVATDAEPERRTQPKFDAIRTAR